MISFILLFSHRLVFSVVLEKTSSLSRAGLVFFDCKNGQRKEVLPITEYEINGKLTHLHALPNGDLVALLEKENAPLNYFREWLHSINALRLRLK